MSIAPRCRGSVESETTKGKGGEWGGGIPFPTDGILGSVMSSPSGVRPKLNFIKTERQRSHLVVRYVFTEFFTTNA